MMMMMMMTVRLYVVLVHYVDTQELVVVFCFVANQACTASTGVTDYIVCSCLLMYILFNIQHCDIIISKVTKYDTLQYIVYWLRGTVVERWSLTSELSLSCAQPAAKG